MRVHPAAKTTASRRGRARAAHGALAALAALTSPACKLNQEGVPPPLDRIAFPASALVDPDGHWLYVTDSNSDLRYNSGTLVAVNLDAAARDRFAPVTPDGTPFEWPLCDGPDRVRLDSDPTECCWDYLDHNILNCDERAYIPPDSTALIGSFAAGMQFQSFAEPDCGKAPTTQHDDCSLGPIPPAGKVQGNCPGMPGVGRIFIGVRGNSTLTYADTGRVTDPTSWPTGTRPVFTCSNPPSSSPSVCTVSQTPPGASPADVQMPIIVPDEPYALTLDPAKDLLYVGNLSGDTMHPQTGGISLFDVSRPQGAPLAAPTFVGPSPPFFNPNANGNIGITSLTLHNGAVYASSRYGTNVVNVVPSFGPGSCPTSDTISISPGSDVFTSPLGGVEMRGIQFMPDPNGIPAEDGNQQRETAFVLQRTPPALIEFDSSTNPSFFGNFASTVLETCAGPTFLQAYDAGEGTRLYVSCFDQGQIYVFDPYAVRLISIINAGRGPAGLAFPPGPRLVTKNQSASLAYIVGFSANDVPVLDITPGSPTQYHIVQRIGFPSLEPR
jgi:hypothetical protein